MLRVAVAFSKLGGVFPAFALVLLESGYAVGVILSVVVFCTSVNDQPPKYHAVSLLQLLPSLSLFLIG